MNKVDLTDSLEKIPVKIFANSTDGSFYVAQQIANLIKQKQQEGNNCVIGLATGSSPKTLYAHLVKMHKEEGLSFIKMLCKAIIILCGRICLSIPISIHKIIICPME
jgi:hypothetical protein